MAGELTKLGLFTRALNTGATKAPTTAHASSPSVRSQWYAVMIVLLLMILADGQEQTTVNSHAANDDVPIKLWQDTSLTNGTHTIEVKVVDGSYPNVCEVDRFVYVLAALALFFFIDASDQRLNGISGLCQ